MSSADLSHIERERIAPLREALARSMSQTRRQTMENRVLRLAAGLAVVLLAVVVVWAKSMITRPAGPPALPAGAGRVCTSWEPTGDTCAGGCVWRRACYLCAEINPPSGCQFEEYEYKCVGSSTTYCPLILPPESNARYGPADPGMAGWAAASGLAWSVKAGDWVNSQGQGLQSVIDAAR